MVAPCSLQTETCIILFVKDPQPGQVKTRLGRSIGNEQAAELYTCFAQDVLTTIQKLPATPLIFFAPPDAQPQIEQWLRGQQYYPQQGNALGGRMSHAFSQCFTQGYKRALIVGSDSPDLPLGYLEEALQQLAAEQVVIGPSEDGGYYALGFTFANYCPDVFDGIAWSTEEVRSQTLNILAAHQRSVHLLPTWYDVDTLNELQRFYQHNQRKTSLSMAYLNQHHHDIFDRCCP
ncbi:MAG: TIGR04282 family arsenosugar biosynthesis glycosyltransferase [Thermosynechococcaceae cyanobacterium]